MKKVLYVLLPQFAEHEMPYLTQPLRSDAMAMKENPEYENKIVAESMEPVEAISGFRLLPDYTFDSIPNDYAALVLIGGYGWKSEAAERVKPLVEEAIKKGRIVGAICNAASWMASKGFLNDVRHTGNGIEQLQLWGGKAYTNSDGYVNAQAVSDKNIVTANGSASLEFACEILTLLKNDEPKEIEMYKTFYKMGLVEFAKMMSQTKPRFSFNTIGLFTTDNAKMVAFYRDIFGFHTEWNGCANRTQSRACSSYAEVQPALDKVNGTDPNVEMTLGDSRIIMFPRDAFEQMTSQQYAYPQGVNGTMEISLDVPCFADVDKEYERAVSMGAKPIFAPTTEPWGQRTCYVADPEGNLIEISSFVE